MSGDRHQFPACDGLRALAASSVFVFHAAAITGLATTGAIGAYLLQLDVGVDVFFVLSGFLLYRSFVRAHLGGTAAPNVSRYFKRRFLRIFPAYWVVLLALLYVFHQAAATTTRDGLIYFGLVQVYSKRLALGGLVPAWSLCTEISFYAFLPLYAWVLRRWARGRSPLGCELLGVACLYLGSCAFRIFTSSHGSALMSTWLPSYLDVFALGMLLAVISASVEEGFAGAWWQVIPRDGAVWWSAAAALFVAASNLGMPRGVVALPPGMYFSHHLLAGTIGALLVCPAVLHSSSGGSIRAALSSRPLRSIGLISYGIFLWHLPWLTQVLRWFGGQPGSGPFWPVFLVSAFLTLLSAWVTYMVIERPLMRRRTAPDRGVVSRSSLLGSGPREQGGSGVAAAIPSETAAE